MRQKDDRVRQREKNQHKKDIETREQPKVNNPYSFNTSPVFVQFVQFFYGSEFSGQQ